MVKATELSKLKKIASNSGTFSATTLSISDDTVVAGDIIFAQLSASTTSASIQKAVCTTDGTIAITFSAAPGASSTINYMIFSGGN